MTSAEDVERNQKQFSCHSQVANMVHQELAIKCGLSKGKQHCIIETSHKLC